MAVDRNKPSGNKEFRKIGAKGGNDPWRQTDGPAGRVSKVGGRVSLPGRGREIDDLIDAVRALPDVRLDKVAAIRKAIESGTYVVDAARVALKMIEEIRSAEA